MPKLNELSYLAFLDKRFQISGFVQFSNFGFFASFVLLLSYLIFLILIFLCKYIQQIREKPSTEKQQKMQIIIEKYKRELLNTSMNQYYQITTDNRGNRSVSSDLEKLQDKSLDISSSENKQLQGNLSLEQDIYLMGSNTERLAQERQIEEKLQEQQPVSQINLGLTTNNCLQLNSLEQQNISPSRKPRNLKKYHNFCTKVTKFLITGNPVCSMFYKESNFFPKHVRLTLLYFQILCSLFVASIICIYHENIKQSNEIKTQKIIQHTIIYSILSQIGFYALVAVVVTRKEKISRTKNDRVFFERLISFEREQKFKIIFLYIFNGIFFCGLVFHFGALTQIVEDSSIQQIWIISTIITLVFYNLMIDVGFLVGLSLIYVKAYKSKLAKTIYRQIDSIRVWAI